MTTEFEQLAPSLAQLRDGKDSLAMLALGPLSQAYLPWSGYAMRPSGVVKILNEMVINQRSTVVECGAGLTTVYIASLLRQRGVGHLSTIEHDAAWLDVVRGLLVQAGLESYVTLIHAPLVGCELSLDGADWYDRAAIAAAIGDREIDLLVVDGPPAYDAARQFARYPAAVYFQPNFAGDFAIVLDDIDRVGEQRILAEWERLIPGLEVKRLELDGGVAICSSRSGFSVS
jgi:predicted O-methyltransferase YrrM